MKLAAFLETQGINQAEFAKRIGVASRVVVYRYVSGARRPHPKVMEAIARETGGAVQPNDFFTTPAAK